MSLEPKAPVVTLATVDDLVAALRVVLPPLLNTAIAEALQRREEPPFVSPQRAHELTGLSLASVRRRVVDGTFVSKKIGGRLLIATDSLKAIDEIAIARAAAEAVAG